MFPKGWSTIDSTFCGVCACLRPPAAQSDRRRSRHRRRNDRPLPVYRRRICRIIQQRCRRHARSARRPLPRRFPRSISLVVSRRSRANQKERALRRQIHPGIKLVNKNHPRARLTTCATFAVPTGIRGSKYARRYEPLKVNE